MADKPIIFSAPMVRALLDGRKTQTRTVIKLGGRLPEFCGPRGCTDDPTCWGWEDANHGDWITLEKERGQRLGWRDLRASYAVGDRLWVREHCATWGRGPEREPVEFPVVYAADDPEWAGIKHDAKNSTGDEWKIRPSIHMPRWASRLTLIVTDVRVQRLQKIGTDDAIAEGIVLPWVPGGSLAIIAQGIATDAFRDLWNSLHGPDAWDANPWVAAITFRVIRANIDSVEATNG